MSLPDVLYLEGSRYRKSVPLPAGYSLYQLKDDFAIWGGARGCASGGCPAVVPLTSFDGKDAVFTIHWQFYLVAINMGMSLPAIISLMGDPKALMNGTGIDGERNNYITGDIGYGGDPHTDKFRSFCLNTHAGKNDANYMYPLAFDGTKPPPLKPGRVYPRTLEEINIDDYLITPQTNRWYFLDCSNVRWKTNPKRLGYGPFANGIRREFIPDNEMHTFFPFITSQTGVRTPLSWWTKLPDTLQIPSPFRR